MIHCVVCVVWHFMNFVVCEVFLGVCFVVYCVVWCCVGDVLSGGRSTIARGPYCIDISPTLNLTPALWKELFRKLKNSQGISA